MAVQELEILNVSVQTKPSKGPLCSVYKQSVRKMWRLRRTFKHPTVNRRRYVPRPQPPTS
ncbi:hypothetical protein L218DRAFT_964410, partial [Marasmius fiardii PR-910]